MIAANNADTGDYTTFSEQNTPYENLVDVIIASSSVPFVFPPKHYNGSYYIDGGSSWNINIDSAVQRCLEIVDDPSKITIDVMICGNDTLNKTSELSKNAIDNFSRGRDLSAYYVNYDSIY